MHTKPVWSDDDFDEMIWTGQRVYALLVDSESYELSLDLDWMVSEVKPLAAGQRRCMLAPATLVFENVTALELDLSATFGIELAHIQKSDPTHPCNAEFVDFRTEWAWNIETAFGSIRFRALGYKMYVRHAPVFVDRTFLGLKQRGGCSFNRTLYTS